VASGLSFREATTSDAPVMAETVGIGFDGYRAFAPAGWEPPPFSVEVTNIRSRLATEEAWALLAHDGDEPAGQVALLPDPAPATAYLWQLFVRPAHWGSGVAHRLHEAFLEEAQARGYEHAPAHPGRAGAGAPLLRAQRVGDRRRRGLRAGTRPRPLGLHQGGVDVIDAGAEHRARDARLRP
jgi:GNAT superfamily N-acetyltransferase